MFLKPLPADDEALQDPAAHADTGAAGSEHHAELLLVRAFVEEAHTTALFAAGVASAVNYAQMSITAEPLIEARSLISSYQSNIANWPHHVLSEELSFDTIQLMSDMDETIRRGRASLLSFEIDGKAIGFHRAVPLHVTKLATAWREVAAIARALVASLRKDLAPIFSDEFAASANHLIKILDGVVNGSSECCRPDGKIVLPRLAERRRAPRHALLQSVLVRAGNAEFRAFANDISSGGMGLMRMPPLAAGTRITIELAVGRSFRGTVVWSRGANAGIAFDEPLSATDPLIFG